MENTKDTMKECMKEDKPLVSILLAIYRPNETWLIEQLVSLNEQNYKNLNLYVYDDCPEHPMDTELLEKHINNFEYKVIRGGVNKGSTKAFEELTKIANGDFFAYCDQDDIWESHKISYMMEKFNEGTTLVCCDLSIIDENGFKTHDSITEIRKRHVFKSGYNLAKDLLISNFVTGCGMIVKREIALKAIPFLDELVHDQWIAIIAALNGSIEFLDESLVRYRQHSNNQTGILTDIDDKESYYSKRIDDMYKRFEVYKNRLNYNKDIDIYVDKHIDWLKSRKIYSKKFSISNLKTMIRYRRFHNISIVIECVLPFVPDFIFKYIIKITKKGIL